MKIDVERNGNILILRLEGKLDTSFALQLQKLLNDQLDDVAELQIDMKKLDYISSAGLRVLLAVYSKMKEKQGVMIVCHVGAEVMDTFEITGFDEILDIR